jgi:hypothetical protein
MKIMQVFKAMVGWKWMALAGGGALWLSGCAGLDPNYYPTAPAPVSTGDAYGEQTGAKPMVSRKMKSRPTAGSAMPWNTPVCYCPTSMG